MNNVGTLTKHVATNLFIEPRLDQASNVDISHEDLVRIFRHLENRKPFGDLLEKKYEVFP